MNRTYAGIGSRETPEPILLFATKIASKLHDHGFTLFSGGARGADTAFESGHDETSKQIWYAKDAAGDKAAYALAASLHPAWDRCGAYAQALHARNCYQILGKKLIAPVDFVLCYTPYGAETETELNRNHNGGTSTAIRLAVRNYIPVFNFGKRGSEKRFYAFMHEKYGIGG